MQHIIDKVLEAQRLRDEIEAEAGITICSINEHGVGPSLHVLGFTSFNKLAKALNDGKYTEVDTGSAPFRWQYEFECRGVTVFCLSNERVKEDRADAKEER